MTMESPRDIEMTTTAMQTDADEGVEIRGSSVLSWPSSYRSSRMMSPDTHRLLDLSSETPNANPKQTTLKLPRILPNDAIEEERTGQWSGATRNLGFDQQSPYEEKVPHLNCSLYTSIGNPSMEKRRKNKPLPEVNWTNNGANRKSRDNRMSQKWKRGNNELDKNNLYSSKHQKHYDQVSNSKPHFLPPMEVSQRSDSQNKADAGTVKEKEIVMRNFFLTGKMKRFEEDKAVVPSVYKNILDNSAKKRAYVNTLYTHQYEKRGLQDSGADCTKRRMMPEERCEFCDVMGNKYCSYCIEFKNRHFALGFEKNFMLPQLPATHAQIRRKRTGNHLARILINAHDGLGPVNTRR